MTTSATSASSSSPFASIAVVAGHICLDIIPTMYRHAPAAASLLMPGQLTHIGAATIAPGGAVSNTGLALHRLGIETRLAGKIGSDLFGRTLLDLLTQRDPKLTDGLVCDPEIPTSYTIVLSAPGLDRAFLHCAGANDTFCADDITSDHLAGASLLHLGYPPILSRFYSDGGSQLVALFERAKGGDIATSLDMAHVDLNAPAGLVNWREYLARVLPSVDIFLPSLDELYFMLDRIRYQQAIARVSAPELVLHEGVTLLQELANTMLAMGVAIAGIKLGEHGFYLRTTNDPARLRQVGNLNLSTEWLGREMLAPAFEVEVAGTTGAGDCAVAAFLAALLRGINPNDALIAAVANGAYNVEVADAMSGIPTWQAMQERIKQGWPQRTLQIALEGWQRQDSTGLYHAPPHSNE